VNVDAVPEVALDADAPCRQLLNNDIDHGAAASDGRLIGVIDEQGPSSYRSAFRRLGRGREECAYRRWRLEEIYA
jgi:hypothetical protein